MRETGYIEKLIDLVLDNAGYDSPLPMTRWSNEALEQIENILSGMSVEPLEIHDGLSKSEATHLLYFMYLRRVADAGALAHYEKFTSVGEVISSCTQTLLASSEYKHFGRRGKTLCFESVSEPGGRVLIDVTNSFTTGSRTGIQRVVRELCSRLPRSLQAKLIYLDHETRQYCYVGYADDDFIHINPQENAEDVVFKSGDIYIDADASWGDPISKWDQYSGLKRAGVRIVNVHFDAVPILFPDYSHPTTVMRYIEHFVAAITFSDLFLCISEAVKADLEKIATQIGSRLPLARVIPMGGNYVARTTKGRSRKHRALKFADRHRFLLCVGTVEPRKNYSAVLQLLPQLEALDLNLIVVGKRGWESERMLAEMDLANESNPRFQWFTDVDDGTLEALYKKCFAYLTSSHYEGYGLPVMEALARQCVVISSDRGALREAGDGHSLVYNADDQNELTTIIGKLATDQKFYLLRKALVEKYKPKGWDETSDSIVNLIEPYIQRIPPGHSTDRLQLVYISILPNNIRRSLGSFVKHANTSRAVVLTKLSLRKDMEAVLEELRVEGIVLCDEDLIGEEEVLHDHQARNYALRSALYARPELDDVFISADDDCVLLRRLPDDFYIKNGRYVGKKSFHAMGEWQASPFGVTSYDEGQWTTADLLTQHGYPDAAYSAHQAQILDKTIANEIFREFGGREKRNLDEWSLYFNVACSRYANKFECRAATTLYWPNSYSSWVPAWFCEEVYFENYYESNYRERGPAYEAGLSEDASWTLKLLHCRSEYDQYAMQRTLTDLLDCAPGKIDRRMAQKQVPIVCGLPNLWARLAFDGKDYSGKMGYVIYSGEQIVVNGNRDPQEVNARTGLMVKLPSKPGEYQLTISQIESTCVDEIDLSLLVYPIRGLK